MGIFDKVKVKTGVGKTNKFDLSSRHVTTQDFFKLRPVYYRELMPGQSINIKHSTFARLMPLDKPMFGGAKIINRGFFVPYRLVFPYFNDFITDNSSIDGTTTVKVTQTPWIYNRDLCNLIVSSSSFVTQTSVGNAYDIYYNNVYYKYTNSGRMLLTILNSCGISVDFTFIDADDKGAPVSLLNFLCYCKVYYDWYMNPAYGQLNTILESYLYAFRLGGYVSAADQQILGSLLYDVIYTRYDNDYFTSAFDNPNVPNDATFSPYSIPDVTNDSTGADNYKSKARSSTSSSSYVPSTPSINNATTSSVIAPVNITQYILDSLKSLTEYLKRYQLVGSRTLDRYLANFGITLDSDKLKRSIYLGKNESVIEVSDVMATANTDSVEPGTQETVNTPVGDYTGKGVSMQRGGQFNYKADEFGCLIIISTILPSIGYVQGVNRMNMHIDRFDFFTPDFDALGPQAIARAELFNDGCTLDHQQNIPQDWTKTGIFGYTPRYAEYCVPNDWLSGDFRFHSRNSELQTWHLFRIFNPKNQSAWSLIQHHSDSFTQADHDQYDRIFNYYESDYDHFIAVHRFDIESNMPKKPLFDQFDWDDGRTILSNLNGTRLN